MASAWRRVGVSVELTLPRDGDHDALWEALRGGLYGVASLDDDALSRARVLSLPEAYYALAEEHLLTLPTTAFATLDAVWRDFAGASSSFVPYYVVYKHFRRLGWRLRSGLNYGAPFVLYRGDADTFHSEYIVYIADEAGGTPWHAVQARTRVAEDVKKTVVLCEVSVDDALEQVEEPPRTDGQPLMETHARYQLHGTVYALDAVLIRYWDPATVDEDRASYAFTPQPMLLKKPASKTKKKSRAKRPRGTA